MGNSQLFRPVERRLHEVSEVFVPCNPKRRTLDGLSRLRELERLSIQRAMLYAHRVDERVQSECD